MAEQISLVEFCEQQYGCNPYDYQGKQEFLKAHQSDLEALKEEFPDMSEAFYEDALINDMAMDKYQEFALDNGFEPNINDALLSMDNAFEQAKSALSKNKSRLVKKG